MKTILFPTDFSLAADKALLYAMRFAERLDARLLTLHVYHLPDVRSMHLPVTLQQVYESIELEEFENFKDYVPHLRKLAEEHDLGHIPMQHCLEENRRGIVSTIIQVAEDEGAEMIIMGTTGASGLKELFLGSVTAETMENAKCPVLAVPESADFHGGIREIVMTVEMTENESRALPGMLEFAARFDAHVTCIHVDTSHSAEYHTKMEKFSEPFKDNPDVTFKILDGLYLEPTVARYVQDQDIDMLAMLTHKRSFLQELFTYSVTKKMTYSSKVPVLAIQAPKRKNSIEE